MPEIILALLLSKVIRLLAGDPSRWLKFRRQLLRVIRSDDPEQSRKGALAIAEQLERVYNMPEGKTTVPLEYTEAELYPCHICTPGEIAGGEWRESISKYSFFVE